MKLTILGGGVAGAVAAGYAASKGINDISLIEKDMSLGGLHRDIVIDDFHYDIGAFFFWPYHKLIHVFPGVKDLMVDIEPLYCLSLTEKGNLDLYPSTLKGYMKDWGITDLCLDVFGLVTNRIKMRLSGHKINSVDDEMKYYLGPFYQKTGLRKYIARLYGMSPSDVGLEFSQKRMSFIAERFRTSEILNKLLTLKANRLNQWTTFPISYARPTSGFSSMYSYIGEELKRQNVNLCFGVQIKEILIDEKKIITSDGKVYTYEHLLSSIPITLLCKLSGIPLNIKLQHKSLYSLFYVSNSEIIPKCHVLYNFTERGLWKRITFHSSYYGTEKNKHYFVVEAMPEERHLNDDGVSMLDQDFKDTFANTEFFGNIKKAELIGSHLTPNAYPIYTKDFDTGAIDEVKQFFSRKSIYLVGRQGEFDYLSSSDVAQSAINTINRLLNSAD
ncbi:MAG: NAD(P)-binding protein [Cyanomargarita calcarea GSE-NOS-MK-12-04C]|jgi:protoporphyrinogen oxidase|uniref:NAD(P)-binding protein n=1 Tax=Cyanomargarita calcarea GSE-NOS-MK-12-04C TaxID=2839659 RepID=A0A951QWP3_9CYAN|nr:NAD(P)-binding protein [Cyanomargarita calcarea GSE-NOS-MK-12-04C]